jgi:hypothetical protein
MTMKKVLICLTLIFNLSLIAQDNYVSVDIDDPDDYDELDNFFGDSILNNYRVFFTGENHQYAYVNSDLEFKLLTYLHQRQGVNHFLFEQSPATGFIINQAVYNKDLTHKTYLKDRFYTPFYSLIKSIKKYNDTLSMGNKIQVHGIDVERFPAFSIFALSKITDTLDIEGKTGIIYEAIDALYTSEFKDGTPDEIYNQGGTRLNLLGDEIDAWATFESIIFNANGMKDELKVELGDNFEIFFEILESLQKGHDWYLAERNGDLSAPVNRERFMIDQFLRVNTQFPNAKFYGQFGRCHLHANKGAKKCYSHNMKSIASRINTRSDSTLNGKVLTIPVYYKNSREFDGKIINSLNLDYRFDRPDRIYLIDLEYLKGDNPLAGFDEDLPFVIVNTFAPNGTTNIYNFNYTLEEYHLGVYVGFKYFNKLKKLNSALTDNGNITFTNKFLTYSVAGDYITMNDIGHHVSYSVIPELSNGDRFHLKGQSISYGTNYPFGGKNVMAAVGLNYTYGQMKLIEENSGATSNLIQLDDENITVYKNDFFTLDPNIDFRITFPVISLNARLGYAFDVSGKYWKLEGKMKDFTKTSFSAPYIQVGVSLNLKDEY